MRQNYRLIIFSCFLVLIDQLLKFIFQENSVCNKNIAWNFSVVPGFFYFAWIIVFIFLIFLFLRSSAFFEKILLVLVLSGAVSNIIDRLSRGCVVDFIDLKFWPAFNLADMFITTGIIFLIIFYIKKPDAKY